MAKEQCGFCGEWVDKDEINHLNLEQVCDNCVCECECGERTDPDFADSDGWYWDKDEQRWYCEACYYEQEATNDQ